MNNSLRFDRQAGPASMPNRPAVYRLTASVFAVEAFVHTLHLGFELGDGLLRRQPVGCTLGQGIGQQILVIDGLRRGRRHARPAERMRVLADLGREGVFRIRRIKRMIRKLRQHRLVVALARDQKPVLVVLLEVVFQELLGEFLLLGELPDANADKGRAHMPTPRPFGGITCSICSAIRFCVPGMSAFSRTAAR